VGDLARQSSLKANDLLEIGRAFDFLEGDEAAVVWFGAALDKAQAEYDKTQPGDPAARPLLYQLEQTKALWRLNDYRALEKRFALAMALNPPLSVESRRAGCLHATTLYYQGRAGDAADAILKVWEQQKQAGDLGALEKSDFGEMDWVTALYLYSARRYDEAIPYYQAFLQTDDNRKRSGAMMFANCLTMAGKKDEAEQVRKQYGIPTPTTRPARMRRTTMPATRPAI
jgi:tetratricopeptide (TPR) repeat protein